MISGQLGLLALGSVWIAAIVVGAIIVLWLLVWPFKTFNRFVRQRQGVKNAWAQIDVQLKRRHDLIPNLVETVKGVMGFEKETLENVTKARSAAMAGAGKGPGVQSGLEGALSGALGKLYLVMESYPDIKSNTNVTQLQEELSSTENRIAFSRQSYNDHVMHFNTAIRLFPASIIAGVTGFSKADFFEIEEADREVPKVDLGFGK